MENKELVIKSAKEKFDGELLDIVLEQINTYDELFNSGYVVENKYNIGDEVILDSNHLLHGIGTYVDILNIMAKRGIVSPDYYGDKSNHAFCYNSAFWAVEKEILLRDYIKNYSGIVAKYNDKYEQVPYGKLDDFVEKMREVNPWLWTSESSMEIRFMPSLAKDDNQIGFIFNMENNLAKKLRSNSIFKSSFNKEYAFEFVQGKALNKFREEGFIADFFERADYLIFGLPSCLIEGVIVGRMVENNYEYIAQIKNLFPNCFICNLDGKVIG